MQKVKTKGKKENKKNERQKKGTEGVTMSKEEGKVLKIIIPIIVAIIGGIFGLTKIYLSEYAGDFEIAAIEYESGSLDIKTINNSSNTVFITGVRLEVLEFEEFVECQKSLLEYNCAHVQPYGEYECYIDFLEEGRNMYCATSQEVKPGCSDRFLTRILNVGCGRWVLKVSLITNEGTFTFKRSIEVIEY